MKLQTRLPKNVREIHRYLPRKIGGRTCSLVEVQGATVEGISNKILKTLQNSNILLQNYFESCGR